MLHLRTHSFPTRRPSVLNRGLREAAQLGQALAPWLAQTDTDPTPLLARFASMRRPDRWLTAGITDFLPRVFSTGNPLIEHAGGLALLALDMAPALRTPLARHLLQRSEEHTSELQSLMRIPYAVFSLKTKNNKKKP